MTVSTRNQSEQIDERFRQMDYRSFVIETPFTYGIATGLSWSFILSGGVLIAHYVFELPSPGLLYCGSFSIGMGLGFSGYQAFTEKAFNEYNKLYSRSGRRSQVETTEPVGEVLSIGDEDLIAAREVIRKSPNHAVMSSRYYTFTEDQRRSLAAFQIGEKVTRRKLEGSHAWSGANITKVWGQVRDELMHIGALDDNQLMTAFGREWSG